jgi:hypothetical protein
MIERLISEVEGFPPAVTQLGRLLVFEEDEPT